MCNIRTLERRRYSNVLGSINSCPRSVCVRRFSRGVPKKYGELITALIERFSPPNQMELHRAQLRERKQKATDSLLELGQSIRRLTNLAYPTALYDVRETLSKEYFIDALTYG